MNTKKLFLEKLLDIFLVNNSLSKLSESDMIEIINKLYSLPDFKKLNILTISTQYPRYGGSATIAYEFHNFLLKNKISASCIFLDRNIENISKQLINPERLKNVSCYNLPREIEQINFDKIRQDIYNNTNKKIDLIFGFNYLAPYVGKLLYWDSIVFYMITGFRLINNNHLVPVKDLMLKEDISIYKNLQEYSELKSVQYSDYIVPNSFLTKTLFEKYFYNYKYKIIDKLDLNDLFEKSQFKISNEKEYDIGFICSNFTRDVKNIRLIKQIFLDPSIKHLKKILIGQNCDIVIERNNDFNIFCAGFLNKEEVVDYLSKIKILLIPSIIESYSISAIEGYESGCVVLSNVNCGVSNFMDPLFILDNLEKISWIEKINTILDNFKYFQDIFKINYKKSQSVTKFFRNYKFQYTRHTILFVTIDMPNIGGASTNTLRLFEGFSHINHFNTIALFLYESKVNEKSNKKAMQELDSQKNMYCLPWNNKSSYYLKKFRNNINKHYGKIDVIFCKNYKVVNAMKDIFPNSKIIFSPSGISSVQPLVKNNFILDVELKNLKWDNIDEKRSFEICTKIICNSRITDFILKKLVSEHLKEKFLRPINLSNIYYEKNNKTNSYINRKYDICFCAYNWKRNCKNGYYAKKIIEKLKNHYKIILIGKDFANQEWFFGQYNLDYFSYLKPEEINKYLNNTKVVVIPSFFDSSPNILVESLKYGCQVVTSKNVGNNDILPEKNVINNYNNIEEWVYKVKSILNQIKDVESKNIIISNINKTQVKYIEDKNSVICNLSNSIREILYDNKNNKNSIVGIYKIPAEVNDFKDFNFLEAKPLLNLIEKVDEEFVNNIFKYDIFFQITLKLSSKYQTSETNYILFDKTNKENYIYKVNRYYPFLPANTNIIVLNDIKYISHYRNASIYFLRGFYLYFYNKFISKRAKSILYPATSLPHKYSFIDGKINQTIYQYDKINKFKFVLVHEDPVYSLVFSNSKNILFNKFASSFYYYKNIKRIYDFCFINNFEQSTKNFPLFIEFLSYLDNHGKAFNVLLINFNITSENQYKKSYKNINLNIINKKLLQSELSDYYNLTKINLTFSGRDAFPRVITESSYCGCYNIALDTLTDGKYFFDDSRLGTLISSPNSTKVINVKDSVSYQGDDELFEKITPYIETSYDHQEISTISKKNFNIDKLIESISL